MSGPEAVPAFEALLEYLRHSRGFDFTGYKRASLMRRIEKRMETAGIESYTEYRDYLEAQPDEFGHLFNTILINVTGFFRDPPVWDYLAAEILPRIAAGKSAGEPIRVWSAGCASGEEAYTLAILLAEALGAAAAQERVKVYATDADEEALNRARQAAFSSKEVEGVPRNLLDRYFELNSGRYLFNKDLRRSVIFGRHDLIQDAPISRVDLLVCRNTLMYFNAETQARVLARFHYALNGGGFLLLGKAETLLTHAGTYVAADLKHRVFTKVAKPRLRERLALLAEAGDEPEVDPPDTLELARDVAFQDGPVAQIVVDLNGVLTLANERARALFSLAPQDLGRLFQDLELSYRPVELRSPMERAYVERRLIVLHGVPWRGGDGSAYLDVQIMPLLDAVGTPLGASVTFADVTPYQQLQEELKQAKEELETANEELQSANEELETTNEELQSSVEELETTNEELHSTNEELETMNEELQSTNQELQTINDELRLRSEELNQSNAFLRSILASLRGGVVVIDRDLQVRIWSVQSEELWGLRAAEVHDQHFMNLDFGLPTERLRGLIRACLAGDSPSDDLILDATNRRGRAIRCHVTCTPLSSASGEVQGAILMMEQLAEPPGSENA